MQRITAITSLVLGLAFPLVPFSQSLTQTIKGRIVDSQSNAPLIGATVVLAGSDPVLGGITDVEGYFRIQGVPIGRQSIQIAYIGYESRTVPDIMVSSGKEFVMEVGLTEDIVQLENVVVVADKGDKGKTQNELATVSALSFSTEETSRFPANFEDPARAVLSFAGVTGGGDDVLNEIVIRGNSPKGLLWRMEGVEIPNPNHFAEIGSSAGGISMLSSNVMSNSDFYTGAFPAQYGNASSGVFDIKLRKGNYDKPEFAAQIGTLGVAASAEGPLSEKSRASYLFNYRFSTLALLQGAGLEILGEQEKITFQDLSFKFFVPTEKMGSFSIWGLGGQNRYQFLPDPTIGDFWHEDEKQYLGVSGITHVAYLGKDTYLESIASATIQFLDNVEDSSGVVDTSEKIAENTMRLSSMLNHKFSPRHSLRVGGIYSNISYELNGKGYYNDSLGLVTFLDDNGSAGFYQAFAQWQYRINERLTINPGVHFSYFDLGGQSYLEPRLGMEYKLGGSKTLTAGAGLHSRRETLALYLAKQENEDGSFTYHNKDLGFTRAVHVVVGYQQMIRPNLRFKSEAYYQHLYDAPVWGDTTTNQELLTLSVLNTSDGYTSFPLSNKGTGRNYGVEFTLEKFFSHNYYFMTTSSIYKSEYTGLNGETYSTRYDGRYIVNLVGGKEFRVGRSGNNILAVNAKVILAGGQRIPPILLEQSRAQGHTVWDFTRNNESSLQDYRRLDIGVSFRRNLPNRASIIDLSVQNVLAIENEGWKYYNPFIDSVISEYQLGMFPNLSYKVEF